MAVFHRQLPVAVKLSVINDHLVCRLCGGYIIEATAVVECFHTFCRSCIVKHVNEKKKPGEKHRCPVCSILIREAQPLAGLRLDRTLQDIIDKLLPRLKEDEEQNEELFNLARNIVKGPSPPKTKPSSSRNSPVERPLPPASEEKVSVLIKPSRSSKGDSSVSGAGYFKKYLRCSARMTVLHLKRFVVEKTGWCYTLTDQVEILCKGNVLRDELTMEFIWRIRWGNLRSLLVLEYALKENTDYGMEPDFNMEAYKRGRKRRRRSSLKRGKTLLEKSQELNSKQSLKKTVVARADSNSSSSEELTWVYDSDGKDGSAKVAKPLTVRHAEKEILPHDMVDGTVW